MRSKGYESSNRSDIRSVLCRAVEERLSFKEETRGR
jgi:hypothetical protein